MVMTGTQSLFSTLAHEGAEAGLYLLLIGIGKVPRNVLNGLSDFYVKIEAGGSRPLI